MDNETAQAKKRKEKYVREQIVCAFEWMNLTILT